MVDWLIKFVDCVALSLLNTISRLKKVFRLKIEYSINSINIINLSTKNSIAIKADKP